MTDTGDALAPGTRLDEFEIERLLGAGGFGVTHLARDLEDRPLARGRLRAGGFGVTHLARDLSLDAWRAVKEYLPRGSSSMASIR